MPSTPRQAARALRALFAAALLCASATTATAELPDLRADSAWRQDISAAPLDPESADIIDWLDTNGGWPTGLLRIDYSIDVVETAGGDPTLLMQKNLGYYEPDCDEPAQIPLPVGGTVEGSSDYQCLGGDCHLIVVDDASKTVYELWQASVDAGVLTATCFVEWGLDLVYPVGNRGPGCVSADASGMPIAPLLIDANEVASDSIDHAIRFLLPNNRVRTGAWVAPASTNGWAPNAPSPAPPRGARLRLRSDYPLETLPNDGARAVAHALQTYGMVLADGGNIVLTARSDRGTTAKWSGLLGPNDLADLQVTDFDVVDGGTRYAQDACVRQSPVSPVPGLERTALWMLVAVLMLAGLGLSRSGGRARL